MGVGGSAQLVHTIACCFMERNDNLRRKYPPPSDTQRITIPLELQSILKMTHQGITERPHVLNLYYQALEYCFVLLVGHSLFLFILSLLFCWCKVEVLFWHRNNPQMANMESKTNIFGVLGDLGVEEIQSETRGSQIPQKCHPKNGDQTPPIKLASPHQPRIVAFGRTDSGWKMMLFGGGTT